MHRNFDLIASRFQVREMLDDDLFVLRQDKSVTEMNILRI